MWLTTKLKMYSNLTKEQLIADLEAKNSIIELQESTIEMYQSVVEGMEQKLTSILELQEIQKNKLNKLEQSIK